jgi:hypothetical protein
MGLYDVNQHGVIAQSANATSRLTVINMRRSQWQRRLRHGSAVARLLELRVRIPPEALMCVCCDCCVLSGRGLCDRPILSPEKF